MPAHVHANHAHGVSGEVRCKVVPHAQVAADGVHQDDRRARARVDEMKRRDAHFPDFFWRFFAGFFSSFAAESSAITARASLKAVLAAGTPQ